MPAAKPLIPAHTSTVICGAVPLPRGAAAALPQRVKLLSWGENLARTAKSRILVGEKTAACLSANQLATACERVPLDYEHQSVPGHPNYVPDPREVAAHGTIEIVPGDGVYLSAIDFTSSGQKFAENYQDVSAVAYLDAESNLLFIRSVALTQHGQICGMEFAEAVAASAAFFQSTPTPNTTMLDYKALLLSSLGLAAAATDEEITSAITTQADAVACAATAAAAAAAAADTAAAGTAGGAAAGAGFTPTLVTLSADVEALRRQGAINGAIGQGKVIPLSDAVLATLPFAALSALLDGLPAGQVATAGSGATREAAAAQVVALSAEQSRAAKALGLTEAEYRVALG